MSTHNNFPSHQDNTDVLKDKEENQYKIVLPCDVKQFGGFIAGLLGKPKETKGEIEGTFTLTPRHIENICQLVTQRVSRQNDSSLVNLGITVHYDDGNSITHHNYQDFESYHPVTACRPVGISINFTYLIKFQGRSIPEKQEINISIETDIEYGHHRIRRWFRSGIFVYQIQHTEITWATDIAGLLRGHVTTIVKKPSKVVNFIIENNSELISYLSFLVFSIVMFLWCSNTLSILDNKPVNFPLEQYWVKSITTLTLLLGCLITITQFFQYHISLRQTSTITLTATDISNQKLISRKYLMSWVIYMFGVILNAFAGVIASQIYTNVN